MKLLKLFMVLFNSLLETDFLLWLKVVKRDEVVRSEEGEGVNTV